MPNLISSKAWTLASMKEANTLINGSSSNDINEFLILHFLGIKNNPPISLFIITVHWNLPLQGWIKVNIDDAAKGAPGHTGCGGIFRTCRDYFKGFFSAYLGICFTFEAEIMSFTLAIEVAF